MSLDLTLFRGEISCRLYRIYEDHEVLNGLKSLMVEVDPKEVKPESFDWMCWPKDPYGSPIKSLTAAQFRSVLSNLHPGNQGLLKPFLEGVSDDTPILLVWC